MRKTFILAAAAGLFSATPAFAQISLGGSGSVTGGVGVDTGRTVGGVTGTLDRTIDRTDRAVNRTVDRTLENDLRVATSADLSAGAGVRDRRGNRVGTVASVSGDTAIVVDGNRRYHVPVAALYRGARGLVSNMTRAELRAHAAAQGGASVRN